MKNFRNLKIWEESYNLTLDIYRATRDFPSEEKFGITSQLRRSSHSISANISEGCGRSSKKDFVRFLDMYMGSACETENSLQLSFDLGYLSKNLYTNLNTKLINVKRMLSAFIKKLKENEDY